MGLNVFAYHYGSNGVSHYRIWQPLKYLPAHLTAKRLPDNSQRVEIPLEGDSNMPGIKSHGEIARKNDLIWSTYVTSHKEVGRLLAQTHYAPVVIDMDDDIFSVDKSSPDFHKFTEGWKDLEVSHEIPEGMEGEYRDKAEKHGAQIVEHEGKLYYVHTGFDPKQNVADLLHGASGITVSTERMAKIARKFNPRVAVIPNSYDPDLFTQTKEIGDGRVRLGLFGANGHYRDWEYLAPVIKRVLSENPHVTLVTNTWKQAVAEQGASVTELEGIEGIPDFFEDIPENQIETHGITEIGNWHGLLGSAGIDIGLAPLLDTQFNRAKSPLRYVEFGGFGIPGVYSKVEPFTRALMGVKGGFLADTPDHWYKRITELIRDRSLRKIMGATAKRDIEQNYHQKDASEKLAHFLQSVRKDYEQGHIQKFSAA